MSIISCANKEDIVTYPDKTIPAKDTIQEVIEVEVPAIDTIDVRTDTLTYLALGDSYTIGSGVKENERWPVQLVSALRSIHFSVENPEIVATSGWTTGNLLSALQTRDLEPGYNLVSLLIGVNNQYQGLDFNVFQQQFIELLEFSFTKVRSRSGLFVLSIPDYGVTPFGKSNQTMITEEINMYNTWIQEICQKNNIKFYNITEISRLAENDVSWLASDYLHPSGKMYAEWVKLLLADPPKLLQE